MELIKRNWKNLIIIIIFVLFAYTLIFDGDFSVILDTIQQCRMNIVAICAMLALSYYVLDGINLTLFTRIYYPDYSLQNGMIIALISPFFNGITPFASGGQVAQVYVYNRQGVDTTTSIGIMLMHFIIYQTILVLYTAGILIFQYNYFAAHFIQLFYLGVIGFITSSAVIVALILGSVSQKFQEFVIKFVFRVAEKMKLIKDYNSQVQQYTDQLDNFRKEIHLLIQNKKVLFTALAVNVVRLTLVYSIPFFAFKSLGYSTEGVHLYVFIGITSFISLITSFIPIPGASGGSEGLFTVMYSLLFGLSKSSCAMLVWRFATYYMMMFIGCMVFIYHEKLHSKKNLTKIDL